MTKQLTKKQQAYFWTETRKRIAAYMANEDWEPALLGMDEELDKVRIYIKLRKKASKND